MYLFFMNVSDIVQYIFYRTYICDAGKVEIICAIRGDSQLKINVLHDGSQSMFQRFYVPKVLYSEGSISVYPDCSMFRRFYIPKVLCSEGSMFRMPIGPMIHCP